MPVVQMETHNTEPSVLQVDVCLRQRLPTPVMSTEELCTHTRSWLRKRQFVSNEQAIDGTDMVDSTPLTRNVERLTISNPRVSRGKQLHILPTTELQIHPYQLFLDDPSVEGLDDNHDVSSSQEPSAGVQWLLPHAEFEDLWDSLYFESDVKSEILDYMTSLILFSTAGVRSSIITTNRLVLFHGPPGTGKTTLAKAVAQKLTIRLRNIDAGESSNAQSQQDMRAPAATGSKVTFTHGVFVEINSHSLFSKWFSESGKLVEKLFSRIRALLDDDPAGLVFILVDEVESLTVARESALSRNEPSDAVRVVNALLTQIDSIRRYPNVLILTTTNLTDSIDPAFLDRADLSINIGNPGPTAIYEIYRSCVWELVRAKILHSGRTLDVHDLDAETNHSQPADVVNNSKHLFNIAKMSMGMSGRALRKIPVITHANYIKKPKTTLGEFLAALEKAVKRYRTDKEKRTHKQPDKPDGDGGGKDGASRGEASSLPVVPGTDEDMADGVGAIDTKFQQQLTIDYCENGH